MSLFVDAFESNTTAGWLNHMVYSIRVCATFKFTKFWRKRQVVFFRIVGEKRLKSNWSNKVQTELTRKRRYMAKQPKMWKTILLIIDKFW